MNDPASISRTDNPLWDALERAFAKPFPAARLTPQLVGRLHRRADLPQHGLDRLRRRAVQPRRRRREFGPRFHGNDERVDVESLRLTTQLWLDVVHDLLG